MDKKRFFTANTLKIIALICMTCDHVGKQLLPELKILQIIGRIAFPVFAFFIAEGCKYTKDRKKYFLTIAVTALLCQMVYFAVLKSLYQCVLVTFSLSILLIYSFDDMKKKRSFKSMCVPLVLLILVYTLTDILPAVFNRTDFYIDYGFFGVLFPVAVYLFDEKYLKVISMCIVLILLSIQIGGIQWYSLLFIPLILLYNGERGKYKLKMLFYIYYPAHLVVLYFLSLFF